LDLPDTPEAAGDADAVRIQNDEENQMAIWGADVEQLRNLGTKLQAGAAEIEQQRTNLSRVLDSTTWEGPDAKHFRSEWSGTHTSALNQVVQALKDAGRKATQNANEQDQASR
jgi:uncharacterized protein YukE